MLKKFSKSLPVFLILSIVSGGLCGYIFREKIIFLKPIGEVYLRLIFTVIVPLLFFSIASAIAALGRRNTNKLLFKIFIIFTFTSVIAAGLMLVIMHYCIPLIEHIQLPQVATNVDTNNYQIADLFAAPTFAALFTHKNVLPLVIFSIFIGLATNSLDNGNKIFINFLDQGAKVFTNLMTGLMCFAPLGFFAYFAVTIAEIGPTLLSNYLSILLIYSISALAYFFFVFTFYVFLAASFAGVKQFWSNIWISVVTSFATCSSIASIPANLMVGKKLQIPDEISRPTIALGAVLHKDGSVLGAVVKISFLFAIYHLHFIGLGDYLTAIVVACLVGMVMGAIPSGGMLGEALILSYYGFPPEALMLIAGISIIIDPIATMLNVTGDVSCAMLVSRWYKAEEIKDITTTSLEPEKLSQ